MPKCETLQELLTSRVPTEGLTEFAKRAGIDTKTLYRLREGVAKRPTRGVLTLLALALKVDLERVQAAVAASQK